MDTTTFAAQIPLPKSGGQDGFPWALEADYQRAAADFEHGLEADDHLAASVLGEVEQQTLEGAEAESAEHKRGDWRPGEKGGRYPEDAPAIEVLSRVLSSLSNPQRFAKVATDFEGWSTTDLLELWIKSRRRTGRWSARDYAVQREITEARSVGVGWWQGREAARYRLPDVPAALGAVLGQSTVRRRLLGLVIEAWLAGWCGVRASFPALASLLLVGKSVIAKEVRWLRDRGLLLRVRRSRIGRDGRAVDVADNWYTVGPRLLDLEHLWRQLDLEAHLDSARALLRRERNKNRARHRRTVARVRERRGGERRRLPFVDRRTWVELELEAAARWEDTRAAHREKTAGYRAEVETRAAEILSGATFKPADPSAPLVTPPPEKARRWSAMLGAKDNGADLLGVDAVTFSAFYTEADHAEDLRALAPSPGDEGEALEVSAEGELAEVAPSPGDEGEALEEPAIVGPNKATTKRMGPRRGANSPNAGPSRGGQRSPEVRRGHGTDQTPKADRASRWAPIRAPSRASPSSPGEGATSASSPSAETSRASPSSPGEGATSASSPSASSPSASSPSAETSRASPSSPGEGATSASSPSAECSRRPIFTGPEAGPSEFDLEVALRESGTEFGAFFLKLRES